MQVIGVTDMASISVDKQSQLARLRRERDKFFKLRIPAKIIVYVIFLILAAFILAVIGTIQGYFSIETHDVLRDYSLGLAIGLAFALIIYILISQGAKKDSELILFKCPNGPCMETAPAYKWHCGECRHLHNYKLDDLFTMKRWPIIGEPCENCGEQATHFECPHCHNQAVLDASRPPKWPAYAPGQKRPTQPPPAPAQVAPAPPLPASPGNPMVDFTKEDLE
jgi:hypothetical protein